MSKTQALPLRSSRSDKTDKKKVSTVAHSTGYSMACDPGLGVEGRAELSSWVAQ